MAATETITKTKWSIDKPHSEIGFRVRHMMITNVRGYFTEYDASIYTSGDDFMTAEIDFWLNPASINTADDKRDTHLKSADFFDTEHFKELHFTGNTIEKNGDGKYKLYGELTIRGITKQVALDVEFGGIQKDPWGQNKAGFTIMGKISRKEWDLKWNAPLETGGVLVSDEVWINCAVQLVKQAQTQ